MTDSQSRPAFIRAISSRWAQPFCAGLPPLTKASAKSFISAHDSRSRSMGGESMGGDMPALNPTRAVRLGNLIIIPPPRLLPLSLPAHQNAFVGRGRRLRLGNREKHVGPAVGTVGIPGDVGIAHRQDALGGVPRHPAIPQTVDHQKRCTVAAGGPLE